MKFLVVATKPWNRRSYTKMIRHHPGTTWMLIDSEEGFVPAKVRAFSPRFIFFLHWSWIVPKEIVNEFECVCFHMTDVPYGRGGSPLQNLISRGYRSTKLTALRMTEEVDAGPVYLKEDLSLEGSAEEVYIRASELAWRMVKRIIDEQLVPQPQTGTPTIFKRRQPSESEVPRCEDLLGLHDFIRMLDADGYPKAFLRRGGFRYEFSRAARYDGRIVADVIITREGEPST